MLLENRVSPSETPRIKAAVLEASKLGWSCGSTNYAPYCHGRAAAEVGARSHPLPLAHRSPLWRAPPSPAPNPPCAAVRPAPWAHRERERRCVQRKERGPS